jgi:hypothetical protein
MSQELSLVRSMKGNGKGGPHVPLWILRGDFLSGYMYPKLHKCLRRVERFRKRKMRYE